MIRTSRCQPLSVRAESHAVHPLAVAMFERISDGLSGGDVPDYCCSIFTTACEQLAILAEVDPPHTELMPAQGFDGLASMRIPKTNNAIVAGSDSQFAIRA